jgi:hypothetical protein
MIYKHNHLLVLDFDGTSADTFGDSPNGINVHVASAHAVRRVFGDNGMAVYRDIGGLQNREPGELVRLILQHLESNSQVHTPEVLTEWYVTAKLAVLIPEISREWPKMYPGVKDLFQGAAEGRIPVNTAIASSGHDEFIHRVFEVNQTPQPDILVTSDVLRNRSLPHRQRYKPFTYQLAEVHRQWLRMDTGSLASDTANAYTGRNLGKPYIAYAGDDPARDGGLALQARIPYIYVPFTKPGYTPHADMGQTQIDSLLDLAQLLQRHADEMESGMSFSKVLLGREDAEVFPSQPESEYPYAQWLRETMGQGSHRERMF